MGTPTPNHPHELRSLLSEYAVDTGVIAQSEYVELAPFHIDVLAPERTLVDKLCILHAQGSKIAQGDGYELRHQARHYYDVHCLLSSASVQDCLNADPDLVKEYAQTAAEDSAVVRRPSEPRPVQGFAASPAFTSSSVLEHAQGEYEREMGVLAYGAVPPFQDVVATVRAHAPLL